MMTDLPENTPVEIVNFEIHRELVLDTDDHRWVLQTAGITLHGQGFVALRHFTELEDVFQEIRMLCEIQPRPCDCPPHMEYHALNCPVHPGEKQ